VFDRLQESKMITVFVFGRPGGSLPKTAHWRYHSQIDTVLNCEMRGTGEAGKDAIRR
jgi:hypothetical protein